MRHFLISDTHFYHKNIIKYCNRPFWKDKSNEPSDEDVLEMNETLIKRWNDVVRPEDLVFHLGDFAFGDKQRIIEIAKRLNGKIYFIMGNHDYRYGFKFWYECGFERVYDYPIIFKNFYILSHEPVFLKEDEELNPSANPGLENTGNPLFNFYGHLHDKQYENKTHYKNCCVEICDYTPFCFESLKEKP